MRHDMASPPRSRPRMVPSRYRANRGHVAGRARCGESPRPARPFTKGPPLSLPALIVGIAVAAMTAAPVMWYRSKGFWGDLLSALLLFGGMFAVVAVILAVTVAALVSSRAP
jgi:hypothetical protein